MQPWTVPDPSKVRCEACRHWIYEKDLERHAEEKEHDAIVYITFDHWLRTEGGCFLSAPVVS